MTSLLILTVGTGTAGKHSDVAQGLANTIRQVMPRKFWLVPSASVKSTPVADLIRETVADLDSFAPWSESTAYHAIANHDDIHECRRLVRDVIAVAKRELRADERLVVNAELSFAARMLTSEANRKQAVSFIESIAVELGT